MRVFYPILFAVSAMAVIGLIEVLLIRVLNKDWWQYKPIKLGSILLPFIGVISVAVWIIGMGNESEWLAQTGALITTIVIILLLGLIVTLPLSGFLNLSNRWIENRKNSKNRKDGERVNLADKPENTEKPEKIDEHRRFFLKGTAAALPLISLTLGSGGVASAFTETDVYIRKMAFENLPSQLNGLRILHLTDSHLGIYKHIAHIEEVLLSAQQYNPDLILMTGDIADELDILPETLKLISEFGAPNGVFAVPGNHEYYRGIDRFIKAHENSPVQLLIDSGQSINIKGQSVYIAGADDPRSMHGDYVTSLNSSINKSFDKSSVDSFKILMSHRPEALDKASELGVNLVLAGHTHGGQMGLGDRSFFENLMPDRYLWGEYGISKTQMYVSSGIGHWFPFRLGCRTEAPIIELSSK
ncbi:MAG: metallophosphoesterase [candidate division Zixibacteria bacterium]|nr:metallophosphoesterase [candidate division Zixibacteria bacterium]